ncbi:MAG: PadR family transcriptional regulator [Candidatus Bathyarchaeota archaeon]|nr:MAG: PadR family transcriptional regulator [Candidatus Bathyarchaeota archaeon]
MSGSEIADRIEEYTDWRPSPGSIYPLLSHMEEVGLIKVHEDRDTTLKRFELTEVGRKHVDEFLAHDDHIRSRNRNIRKMYWKLHTGMTEELYNSLRNLLDVLEEIYTRHREEPDTVVTMKAALDAATLKIKEIES